PGCLAAAVSFALAVLSLHAALPICLGVAAARVEADGLGRPVRAQHPSGHVGSDHDVVGDSAAAPAGQGGQVLRRGGVAAGLAQRDRTSTRLNSSHVKSSYALYCLKK